MSQIQPQGSKPGKLAKTDAKKIGIGAAIAALAAALTYLLGAIGDFDLGGSGPLITAVLGVIINSMRKLSVDTTQVEGDSDELSV